MTSHQRIESFARLGRYLQDRPEAVQAGIQAAQHRNPWFTPEQVGFAVDAWADLMEPRQLKHWIDPHLDVLEEDNALRVGLILAGNIPLVGWHDILTCLIAGFKIEVKPASADAGLSLLLLNTLQSLEPAFNTRISVVDKLRQYDAIIATGSNNSARYFDYYFKNVPHVIRKNRNAVAVLRGDETQDELHALGRDIFTYFGLGCRNVSKIYAPPGYDFTPFFEAIESYNTIGHHHKYRNNYDYYKSIYLVNRDPHLDNGFLLLKEAEEIASPLGVVYYQSYRHLSKLQDILTENQENIQCIVGKPLDVSSTVVPFGSAQQPGLNDFADGVSIFDFLKAFKRGECPGAFIG